MLFLVKLLRSAGFVVLSCVIFALKVNAECNTDSLKSVDLGKIEIPSRTTIKEGEVLRLDCRKPYGYFEKGNFRTTINATCNNNKIETPNVKCTETTQTTCNVRSLSSVALGEVDAIPDKTLEIGQEYELKCKRPYGYIEANKEIKSGFLVKCEMNAGVPKINTFGRECKKACDISSIVDVSRGISTQNSKLLNNAGAVEGSIPATKLVDEGQKVKVQCIAGLKLIDVNGNATNEESITYVCGDKSKIIPKCTEVKIKIIPAPPKSSLNAGFIPKLQCGVNELVTPNGKIPAGITKAMLNPGEELEVTCNAGYSAVGGPSQNPSHNVLVKTFQAKCDTNGTGRWENQKACLKRCNVTTLLKGTQGGIETSVINNPQIISRGGKNVNALYVNTINSNTGDKFIDAGDKIKITCQPGYQIRSTLQNNYETSCLDGTNFSVGNKVPVCEPEVKPCNNSEIQLNGSILQNSSLKNGTTNVGAKLEFKCQGDAGNQEGVYFQNGNNPSGVPVCKYNASTKQAEWSHKTFDCYDGCINPNGQDKTITGGTEVSNSVKDTQYLGTTDYVDEIWQYGDNSKIKPGIYYYKHAKLWERDRVTDVIEETDTIKNPEGVTVVNVKYKEPITKDNYVRMGVVFVQKSKVSYCTARQTELKIIEMEFRLLKAAVGFHTSYHTSSSTGNLVMMPFGANYSYNCTSKNEWKGHRGGACYDRVKSDYFNLKPNLNGSVNFSSDNATICNQVLRNVLKIPNAQSGNCRGWGEYHVGDCNNYRSREMMIQSGICTINGKALEANVVTPYNTKGDDDISNSNKQLKF